MIKFIFFLFLPVFLFLVPAAMNAQDAQLIVRDSVSQTDNSGRFRVIDIRGHSGMHIYSGKTLEEALVNGFGSFEVRYGWQSSSPNEWGAYYGYPSYGIGIYSGYIGDPQIFGNPNALYGWVNFPLSRPEKRNRFGINTAFGLTYNLAPYNPETNPLNDAIGARMAVYFDISFEFAYQFTREADLIYGLDFAHFSNGRTFTPNYGLNMFGLMVGMRYHYNADQHKVTNDPYTHNVLQARFQPTSSKKPERIRKSSIEIYSAIGTVQNDEDAGTDTRYVNFSSAVDYKYEFNRMHAITGGIDYFYDSSLESNYPDDPHSLLGLHLGYDFRFWRIAIRFQAGSYITDDYGKNRIYLRPGFRYNFNHWLASQIALKTYRGAAADWIEWGIVVTPFTW